jgi:predicted alpha/beta hydrolase family esterase
LTKEIICIYSDNDSYLKKEAVLDFADKVATKQVLIKWGWHLNSEAGYNSFEELLKYI